MQILQEFLYLSQKWVGSNITFEQEYSYKEHLGNLRASFREGETRNYFASMDNDNFLGFHNFTETRSGEAFHSYPNSSKDDKCFFE